jgi:PPP family 3-phenylpropionic acid transporter
LADTKLLMSERRFRWFLLSAFFGMGAQTAYDLCSSLHFRDHGASSFGIGLAWASGAGSEVLMMVYSQHLLRRFSPAALRGFAFLIAALRWALMASFDSLPALLALQPLHAITFGLMWVSSIHIVKTTARPSNLASAQGLFVGTASLGGALALTAWGTVYSALGGSAVFYAASAVSLLALAANSCFALCPEPTRTLSFDATPVTAEPK